MLRHLAAVVLALGLAAPAGADTYERDPTAERLATARDLVEIVFASAVDPRREGDALAVAAEAASLAWEIEPDLGLRLFDEVIRRCEVLLASASTNDRAIDAIAGVLAVYASRDPNAAFEAAKRIARAADSGARVPERPVVMARVAEALAPTNPRLAERFLAEASRGAATSPHTWRAIRAFDEDRRSIYIRAGLLALEGLTPTMLDLLGIAATVDLIAFDRGPEPGHRASPTDVRRWLSLATRRLDQLRVEILDARRDGRPYRVDPFELAAAESAGPAILVAVERWLPEAARVARAAVAEVAAAGPYDRARELVRLDAVLASDRARLSEAFDYARDGREKEARAAVAAIEYDVIRDQAADEIWIVLAARDVAREDWAASASRLARIVRKDLRVRATGLLARLVAEQGERALAAELAAEAVRLGAKAPRTRTTVAGLLEAATALELSEQGARASEALAEALRAFDREVVDPREEVCRCGQFAETRFGDATLSGGQALELADLPFQRALDGPAARDLLGTRLIVDGVGTIEKREAVQLALARALLSL